MHFNLVFTHHSTETALVKVVNDPLLTGDSGNLSILLLLDLSSAFDTVCHRLLLSRLSEMGVSGAALSWFSSYLTDRQYYITMHNYKSPTTLLSQGAPQGSVLGPLLFITCIMPPGHYPSSLISLSLFMLMRFRFYTACRPDSIHQTTSLSPDPHHYLPVLMS